MIRLAEPYRKFNKIVFNLYIINIGFLLVWFSRFVFHLIVYGEGYSKVFGWSLGFFWDFFVSFFSLGVWVISRLLMFFLEKRDLYDNEIKNFGVIKKEDSIFDLFIPLSATVFLLIVLKN